MSSIIRKILLTGAYALLLAFIAGCAELNHSVDNLLSRTENLNESVLRELYRPALLSAIEFPQKLSASANRGY